MSEKEIELLKLLRESLHIYQDKDVMIDNLRFPDWKDDSRIHNWKNYVPIPLKKLWKELSIETKIVIYCFAERQAGNEEWD